MSGNRNIIITSGMSGAGKTTTMSIFEDMNYVPIDNMPSNLLNEFVGNLAKDESSLYQNVVLGVNIMDFKQFFAAVLRLKLPAKVIFLTSSDDELLRRYNYNRRAHPLILQKKASNDVEAIQVERLEFESALLAAQEYGYVLIDTTHLTKRQLIAELELHKELKFNYQLNVIFESFGFRKGIPLDADFVFDVRFLDNPYWDESLREKTGDDDGVVQFVKHDGKYDVFFTSLVRLLDHVIASNLNMDRSNVVVAIGCTGGQHRSVVVANELFVHYCQEKVIELLSGGNSNSFIVSKFHRDMEVNQHLVMTEKRNNQ